MAKDTPSMAKNKIRRSLLAILDPLPSKNEADELWSYFGNSCAYCGVHIDRSSRTGHIDHVVSSARGGSNCIYNHVLACARCNGDEKREEDWLSFLQRKATDSKLAQARITRIQEWIAKAEPISLDSKTHEQIELIIQTALANYDQAVQDIRALRKRSP